MRFKILKGSIIEQGPEDRKKVESRIKQWRRGKELILKAGDFSVSRLREGRTK